MWEPCGGGWTPIEVQSTTRAAADRSSGSPWPQIGCESRWHRHSPCPDSTPVAPLLDFADVGGETTQAIVELFDPLTFSLRLLLAAVSRADNLSNHSVDDLLFFFRSRSRLLTSCSACFRSSRLPRLGAERGPGHHVAQDRLSALDRPTRRISLRVRANAVRGLYSHQARLLILEPFNVSHWGDRPDRVDGGVSSGASSPASLR